MRITLRGLVPALTVAALMAVPSFAATISLGIAGDAQVGVNFISFGQYPVGPPYNPAPNGYGTFEVTAPVTDIFSANGIAGGEFGTIRSLANAYEMPGANIVPPINFMNFLGSGSNLQLFLTQLQLPAGNPPNDPFVLTDTASGATASFSTLGYVLNTANGSQTPFNGVFSATFAGTTVAQLLAALPQVTPFSGTFVITPTTPVPEPASLLLMGMGLLGAGVVARKRYNRAQ